MNSIMRGSQAMSTQTKGHRRTWRLRRASIDPGRIGEENAHAACLIGLPSNRDAAYGDTAEIDTFKVWK